MSSAVFLKIEGPPIEGESTAAGKENQIELLSYSHGVSMSPGPRSTAGSATTERSSHGDVSVMKQVDKATPKLAESVCKGTHHGTVTISINKADGQGGLIEFMKYILTDVLITSAQISGSDGGGLPMESISFNYGTIKWEYVPTSGTDASAMGTVPFKWDVAKNQPA